MKVVFTLLFLSFVFFPIKSSADQLLSDAIRKGKIETVKELIAVGANVNSGVRTWGKPPLHLAVAENQIEIAKVLIAAGADVNARDGGDTPLHLAVTVPMDTRPATEEETTLAPSKHYFDMVKSTSGKEFSQLGADASTYAENRIEIVKALIAAGADVNVERDITEMMRKGGYKDKIDTPLSLAVAENRIEIAKALIATGADVNAKRKDIKKTLIISEGIHRIYDEYEDKIDTPLSLAIAENLIEMAKVLIAAGADVNAGQSKGGEYTKPLHLAVAENRIEMAKVLIAAGADVNAMDSRFLYRKNTPLYLAVAENRIEMAKALIATGADSRRC